MKPRNSHSSPLFKKKFILKFLDKVNLENSLFVSKSVNNPLPSLFNGCFYFHLTNTTLKLLGLTMAIFISLLTKVIFMARILLLQVQLMLGITHRRF